MALGIVRAEAAVFHKGTVLDAVEDSSLLIVNCNRSIMPTLITYTVIKTNLRSGLSVRMVKMNLQSKKARRTSLLPVKKTFINGNEDLCAKRSMSSLYQRINSVENMHQSMTSFSILGHYFDLRIDALF